MEAPTVHDQDFYIGGADCVILVDNTLFKVSDVIFCFILPPHRSAGKSLTAWTWQLDVDIAANLDFRILRDLWC